MKFPSVNEFVIQNYMNNSNLFDENSPNKTLLHTTDILRTLGMSDVPDDIKKWAGNIYPYNKYIDMKKCEKMEIIQQNDNQQFTLFEFNPININQIQNHNLIPIAGPHSPQNYYSTPKMRKPIHHKIKQEIKKQNKPKSKNKAKVTLN